MGTLTPEKAEGQYTRYVYKHNGNSYRYIHVFRTKAGQTIAPGLSMSAKNLAEINPASSSPTKVIAKINGGMFDVKGSQFYGFFYQGANYPMYVDGKSYSRVSEIPDSAGIFTSSKYWPSFCVKKDGTATIRWFANKSKLSAALPYCNCVIGSAHPMVYNGVSVLKVRQTDYDGVLICNPSNLNDANARFNGTLINPNEKTFRTLLGHTHGSNGIYVMVCAGSNMTLSVAADLMVDLGCEVAVNLDGGTSTQMRIKTGYGPAGKVTPNYARDVFNAVCAVLK